MPRDRVDDVLRLVGALAAIGWLAYLATRGILLAVQP